MDFKKFSSVMDSFIQTHERFVNSEPYNSNPTEFYNSLSRVIKTYKEIKNDDLPVTTKQKTTLNAKEVRKQLGISQLEMSELLGLGSPNMVSEYERGVAKPSKRVFILLYLIQQNKIKPSDIFEAVGYWEQIK